MDDRIKAIEERLRVLEEKVKELEVKQPVVAPVIKSKKAGNA